jgi:hypothetical protein
MCVKQQFQWRSTFPSSGWFAGQTISPRISIVFFIEPSQLVCTSGEGGLLRDRFTEPGYPNGFLGLMHLLQHGQALGFEF